MSSLEQIQPAPVSEEDHAERLDDHIETLKNPNAFERFTFLVSEGMGKPANIIFWIFAVVAWTSIFAFGGPHLSSGSWLPAWFIGQGFNFPMNLFTTVLEMFLGFLVAAAANRSQAALTLLLEHIRLNVDRDVDMENKIIEMQSQIIDMESKLATLLQEDTKLTYDVHTIVSQVQRDTSILDEIHRHVTALSPGAGAFPPPAA